MGSPVALWRTNEAQPLVDAVGRVHAALGREHDTSTALHGPGALHTGPHEGLADTPATRFRRDREHPDLGLARAGDVGHGAARRDEGHTAEHPALRHGDEHVGRRRPGFATSRSSPRYSSFSPKSSSPSPR